MSDPWRSSFAAGRGYLNTATVGLAPEAAVHEIDAAVRRWQLGQLDVVAFDESVDRARVAWARLAGVLPDNVAIGAATSGLVGLIAASLPDGAQVLVAEGDFTSVLFPFLVQQDRRVRVEPVPLDRIVESVDDGVDLVAVSAVQSADGRIVDVEALTRAAKAHGAAVLLDITQACGWLPLDLSAVDYVVCSAYKWLLCPRGVAFLAVRPERLSAITPHAAGWYAGQRPWDSIYGLPLRLADDARRLDTSPAWFSLVAAAPALEFLADQDLQKVHSHNVALADAFLAGLDEPAQHSAIVSVGVPGDARAALAAAGVSTAIRGGRVRASFHLYNDADDVALAVEVLRGVRS